MISLNKLVRSVSKTVVDNSPAILTAMAVAGVATTAFMAVRATPRALEIIEDAENENSGPITKQQKVQITLPCYIPALAVGAATMGCIIGANSINSRRNAALMSVYSLTETAFKEYQEKVEETIGKNKEQKIRDDIAKDRVDSDPLSGKQIIITGNGDVLCYDSLTGRYFQSSMETIRKAQNDINSEVINDMYASQNDFYRLIGLPSSGIGEELGWNHDNLLDIQFSTVLAEDGRPCLALNYKTQPIRGYYKMN